MPSLGFNGNNLTKKKHKPSYRPKIRWEFFGLPNSEPTKPSIDVIRSEVSTLAATRLVRERIPAPIKKSTAKPPSKAKAARSSPSA